MKKTENTLRRDAPPEEERPSRPSPKKQLQPVAARASICWQNAVRKVYPVSSFPHHGQRGGSLVLVDRLIQMPLSGQLLHLLLEPIHSHLRPHMPQDGTDVDALRYLARLLRDVLHDLALEHRQVAVAVVVGAASFGVVRLVVWVDGTSAVRLVVILLLSTARLVEDARLEGAKGRGTETHKATLPVVHANVEEFDEVEVELIPFLDDTNAVAVNGSLPGE
jgi:hypothetical protein